MRGGKEIRKQKKRIQRREGNKRKGDTKQNKEGKYGEREREGIFLK